MAEGGGMADIPDMFWGMAYIQCIFWVNTTRWAQPL